MRRRYIRHAELLISIEKILELHTKFLKEDTEKHIGQYVSPASSHEFIRWLKEKLGAE